VENVSAANLRAVALANTQSGAGQWAEAARLWEQAVQVNPVNGTYWSRLAQARFALQDYAGALAASEKVKALGMRPDDSLPVKDPAGVSFLTPGDVSYTIACCHAGLGNTQQAIDGLADALDQGFRHLGRPLADDCWKPLLGDKRLRQLLGLIDTDELPRDEGWRMDLRLLAREIKRRSYAPFAQLSEGEFDNRVSLLASEIPALTDAQIMIGMMKLLPLDDGHAYIHWPETRQDLARCLPVDLYRFPEGVFITAAAPAYRELLGAQLELVEGHPVDAVLAAVEPMISHDNAQQVKAVAPTWLRRTPFLHALGLIPDPAQATLKVRLPSGANEDFQVEAVPIMPRHTYPYPPGWITVPDTLSPPVPLYLRNRELAYWFDYLPADDLVYFQFNAVRDHPGDCLAAFTDRLFDFIEARRPAGLVIDMRWNGGGNTFLTQPLLHRLIGCRMVNRLGALFVIIGRHTFSAAQNTATAIERETQAIFVGEPTGSRPNFIGETVEFELPYSKLRANVSDLYWQTSWPVDQRIWIAPQIYAPTTFESFAQNRDPALEAILGSHEHLPSPHPR
jgi:hypothetical protein